MGLLAKPVTQGTGRLFSSNIRYVEKEEQSGRREKNNYQRFEHKIHRI